MNDDSKDVGEKVVPARGFARLTPEQRRALGSKGGRVAHERGTANRFDSESGSAAGRIPHERGTAYRWSSAEASAAGRKGANVPRKRKPRSGESS
jgi:hypothetical protein